MVLVRSDSLSNSINTNGVVTDGSAIKVKLPKRILHFSDGVMEEYSSDEENDVQTAEEPAVNPAELTWGSWLWYKTWSAGVTALYAADYAGETLASFFGITTPRYALELEEHTRRQEELKKRTEEEKGWSKPADSCVSVPLNEVPKGQPKPVDV